MVLTYSNLFLGVLVITLALLNSLFSLNRVNIEVTLFISIITSLILIVFVKNIVRSYTSLSMIFIAFFILYGMSGPIEAEFGEGLHELFTKPYTTYTFINYYCLAIVGLVFGIITVLLVFPNWRKKKKQIYTNPMLLYYMAIFFSFVAVVMEIINFMRVGGFQTIGLGKAGYQSLLASLTLTLPSFSVAKIATGLLCISIISGKKNKEIYHQVRARHVTVFVLTILPFIFITVLLGQRGELLTLFIILLVGLTYNNPIEQLKRKFVILMLVVYILLVFLHANRALISTSFAIGDANYFWQKAFNTERIVSSLNPAGNEFGSSFGNFSEYINSFSDKKKMGETYLKGLLVPIPSFIYPGEKPKQITYEFRDRFFPSEAKRGEIAGTGFSSLLEAYMNFRGFGVFIIYLLIGCILTLIDQYRVYSSSIFFILFYLMILQFAQTFHRSAFGDVFGGLVHVIFLIIIAWAIYNFLRFYSRGNYYEKYFIKY